MREEEIRNAVDGLDPQMLKDALALLLDTGVRTGGGVQRNKVADSYDFKTFADAIVYLKKNYDFNELNRFSTEADLVYVNTGDRKVLLTQAQKPQREEQRRFANVAAETEDDFFANAWEPVQKQPESKPSSSSAPGVQTQSSSDPFGGFAKKTDTSDSDAKRHSEDKSSNGKSGDDGSSDGHKSGRFGLLEL